MDHVTMRWHWLGLGGLGVLVGYFVSLSESPVIATLLPLLFGVIAGVSGFVLGKTNFRSADSILRVRFWGIGFFAFSVAVLTASLLGLLAKNYLIASSIRSVDLTGLDVATASDLVGLRRKLQILGASGIEQDTILLKARESALTRATARENAKEFMAKFIPATEKADIALDNALLSKEPWSEDTLKLLKASSAVCKTSLSILKNWGNPNGSSIGIEGMQLILLTMQRTIDETLGATVADDVARLLELSRDTALAGSLFQLKALLEQYSGAVTNGSSPEQYSTVDRLTELLVAGKVTQDRLYSLFASSNGGLVQPGGV